MALASVESCLYAQGDRDRATTSHEIVQEVLVAVLVAGLGEIVLSHYIVVGMVSLPC
jgi:hypothetical protein